MNHAQKLQFAERREPDRMSPIPVLSVNQAAIAAASPAGFAIAADEHHIRRRGNNDVLRKRIHASTIERAILLHCGLIEEDMTAEVVFQDALILQKDELLLRIAVRLNSHNSHHAGLDLETG